MTIHITHDSLFTILRRRTRLLDSYLSICLDLNFFNLFELFNLVVLFIVNLQLFLLDLASLIAIRTDIDELIIVLIVIGQRNLYVL